MTKQVTIYLSRRLTLTRAGQDSVNLEPGRNIVDEDVAAHPFVKAHTTEAVDATPDEVAGLRARVASQNEHIDSLRADRDDLQARHDKHAARVAELESELAALKASKPGRKAKPDDATDAE